MFRFATAALLATVVLASHAVAQAPASAELVKVSADGKSVEVKVTGGTQTYTLGPKTQFLDAAGKPVKDGLKDKRFAAGSTVKVVPAGRTKVLQSLQVAGEATAKAPAKPPTAKPETKPETKPKTDDAKDAKGTPATVVKVDTDKRTATVEMSDGKKVELTIPTSVKFLGPKGGARPRGIKDEVFVTGAPVRLVYDDSGDKLEEIHLPNKSEIKMSEKDK